MHIYFEVLTNYKTPHANFHQIRTNEIRQGKLVQVCPNGRSAIEGNLFSHAPSKLNTAKTRLFVDENTSRFVMVGRA